MAVAAIGRNLVNLLPLMRGIKDFGALTLFGNAGSFSMARAVVGSGATGLAALQGGGLTGFALPHSFITVGVAAAAVGAAFWALNQTTNQVAENMAKVDFVASNLGRLQQTGVATRHDWNNLDPLVRRTIDMASHTFVPRRDPNTGQLIPGSGNQLNPAVERLLQGTREQIARLEHGETRTPEVLETEIIEGLRQAAGLSGPARRE